MTTQEANLQKLELILKMMDENISKEEFVASFENVVNLIKQMQAKNEEEIATMKSSIQELSDEVKTDNLGEIGEMKQSMDTMMANCLKLIEDKLATITNGENGEDGEDGNDAPPVDEQKIIDEVSKKIPVPSLQAFRDELDAFRTELDNKIKSVPETKPFQIFGPGKTRVVTFDLSSSLDGVTKTFFLGTHFGIIGVESSSFPFGAFRSVVDYNEVGKNMVFTSAIDAAVYLAQGQSLIVRVLK